PSKGGEPDHHFQHDQGLEIAKRSRRSSYMKGCHHHKHGALACAYSDFPWFRAFQSVCCMTCNTTAMASHSLARRNQCMHPQPSTEVSFGACAPQHIDDSARPNRPVWFGCASTLQTV